MARKPTWPPRLYRHVRGYAFVRWQGKEYHLGRYDSPEATAAYARLLVDLQAGRTPQPKKPAPLLTVADVVAKWVEMESPRLSERGRERPQYRLATEPLLRLFGPTPAAEFDADKLETLQLAMANGTWLTDEDEIKEREKRSNRGPLAWSCGVVNARIGRIKTIWRWAERKKLVPDGSWGALRTLPGLKANDERVRHTPKVKAANWPDFAAVLAECDPAAKAFLRLLWWSGMRPGELRIMRRCDIDQSDPDCWVYRPEYHKNDWRGQERLVPLGPRCQAILRWWWRLQDGDDPPDAYVIRPQPNDPTRPYQLASLSQFVRRAAQRAGVPGFHPYRCRHSAKKRITREHNLDAARAALGQKSLSVTNSYDEQLDIDTAKRAMRKSG